MMRPATLLIALLLVACFNPSFHNTRCTASGECPDGFECIADVCQPEGTVVPDAAGDAPSFDAGNLPCYQEASDETNQTTAEATGRTVPADVAVICGQLDTRPPEPNGNIDVDRYAFNNVGVPLGVRISAPGAESFDLGVMVSTAPDTFILGTFASLVGSRGLVTVHPGVAGQVILTLVSRGTVAPASSVPYEITVEALDTTARCPVGAITNAETLDTPANMHSGNDVLLLGTAPIGPPLTLTAGPDDDPETAPSIGIDTQIIVGGTAEFVSAAADGYRDHDTWLIHTTAATTELDVQLTFSGTDDLDLWLVRESDRRTHAVGYHIGPEIASVAVEPDTNYYLTIALFGGTAARPYQAAICGEQGP